MKITSVKISKEIEPNGLDDIDIHGMGQVVLLAGKNGSGKTRFLNKLQYACNNRNETRIINTLNHYRGIEPKTEPPLSKDQCNIETIPPTTETFVMVDMSIPKPELTAAHDKSPSQLDNHARASEGPGCTSMHEHALSAITDLQEQWINEKALPNEPTIINEYESLCELIKILLGTNLSRDNKRQPMLFDMCLSELKLSKGEQILLQLCVTLHKQKEKLDKLVLYMDEPENHLHPSVIIEVIDRLLTLIPMGQIWIATHSVNIISRFYNGKNLWYINYGKISFISRSPEQVIKGLIGEDDDIMKLRAFINDPINHAMVRFASECLCSPETVTTPLEDRQCTQIYEILMSQKSQDNPMLIVDFGAGKGRLLSDLAYLYHNQTENFPEKINYIAFDSSEDDAECCKAEIVNALENHEKRYFNKQQELLNEYKKSVDIVIMCNVLHEIPPDKWIQTFKNVSEMLNEHGHLLIVENHQTVIGEMAHEYGFIVLDTDSLKLLFQVQKEYFNVAIHKDRSTLKVHAIGKQLLMKVTKNSMKQAFCKHKEQSIDAIRKVRENNSSSYNDGLKHAFWVHQHTNTSLYLKENG